MRKFSRPRYQSFSAADDCLSLGRYQQKKKVSLETNINLRTFSRFGRCFVDYANQVERLSKAYEVIALWYPWQKLEDFIAGILSFYKLQYCVSSYMWGSGQNRQYEDDLNSTFSSCIRWRSFFLSRCSSSDFSFSAASLIPSSCASSAFPTIFFTFIWRRSFCKGDDRLGSSCFALMTFISRVLMTAKFSLLWLLLTFRFRFGFYNESDC